MPDAIAHPAELGGVGALKTIDGLLEIADHEYRPPALFGLAGTGEIFPREGIDDLPLVAV